MKKNIFLAGSISLLFPVFSAGQFKEALKMSEKALEKSPTKVIEKYFHKAPISTSFDDARTEVDLLGNFDPRERQYLPFSILDRDEEGDYIISEGLYTTTTKSFCLKPGTHGPSQGDGHLYAPLLGPKDDLFKSILGNWQSKHPGIPQQDVQSVIWAIIAQTDVEKIDNKYKLVMAALLDKKEIAKLGSTSLKDRALEMGMSRLKNQVPQELYKIYEAESNLRNLFGNANSTYSELEHYAVLAGAAPASDMIRQVSKERWSFHPNGFFIRLSPRGYTSTKVDVYIPYPVQAMLDELGRVSTLSYQAVNTVEFHYKGNTNQLNSVKLLNDKGQSSLVELKYSLQPAFAGNDFDIENKFSPPKNSLNFSLDKQGKQKLYNLSVAAAEFKKPSDQEINKELRNYIIYMLDEAHNYSVYENASVKKGNARGNKMESHENPPAELSGPHRNSENWIPADVKSQDFGLDLPSTVGVPANRSAQRIGNARDPKGPPWYSKLPPCPCTYKAAQDSAKKYNSGWMDCGNANQEYHFGATTEVRWKPKKYGDPGQQCTYDKNGNLITSGIASGSPDKVSPQGCGPWDGISMGEASNFLGHRSKDMNTWETLSCEEYLKGWPANNANNCSPSNPVSDISQLPDAIRKLNCRKITELFQNASTSKNISNRLKDFFMGNSNQPLSNDEIVKELSNWYKNEGCPGGGGCDVIREVFSSMTKRN